MSESEAGGPEVSRRKLSRRSLLAKGAVAGGIIWVAPVIASVPAYAAVGSGNVLYVYYYYDIDGDNDPGRPPNGPEDTGEGFYYVKYTVTGNTVSSCSAAVPPTGTCTQPNLGAGNCTFLTASIPATGGHAGQVKVTSNNANVYLYTTGSFITCGTTNYRPSGGNAATTLFFNCGGTTC